MYRFANHFPRIGTILNDSQSDISFQNCINMPHVTCGQPRIIHELVRDPQDMDHKLSDLDMMRNLAIKFEKGFVTAKKAMSSNQALLGRNSGSSDSTSKLTLADREDNDSLRHQFNLIKSPTEKESFRRYIFLIHFD